ncbi:isoprenylcysteine carboxyl methyltransferase family protein [Halobacillus litoralis]|uniref:isoprenylcysteine carboxyl methyltransferase family protein n=1 Tax=Halobacillus litoralis TaxID=45668 RepID=UPI002490D112|nr:isoprenylcysteine carboxylmethyltransferase family protein [Halobacillus litoralis]
MDILLWMIFAFLIFQRLGELALADRNRKWMLERGAIESGQGHYFLFVLLHTLFFLCLMGEFLWTTYVFTAFFYLAFSAFIILQALRVWCIRSLGKRWNTRILVLPDEAPIRKGIYRYIKHPNYVIVFFELLIIPLLFHAYMTAVVFPFFHLLILAVRIPAEEQALEKRV